MESPSLFGSSGALWNTIRPKRSIYLEMEENANGSNFFIIHNPQFFYQVHCLVVAGICIAFSFEETKRNLCSC